MKRKKQVIDSELVRKKVGRLMAIQKVNYDILSERVTNNGYSIDKGNLQMYINQRDININLGYALAKSFGVPLDLLFDNETPESYLNGFDYNFRAKRYTKYHGDYFAYFCPTKDSKQHLADESTFSIDSDTGTVKLHIGANEIGGGKIFKGNMLISETTRTLFITLRSEIGEIVQVIMNDQELHTQNFEFCIGIAISVSAGDLKRIPVAHRFVICKQKLSDEGRVFVSSHLNMNNKFIQIKEGKRMNSLQSAEKHNELIGAIVKIISSTSFDNPHDIAEFILMALHKKMEETERLALCTTLQDLLELHFESDAHDMAYELISVFKPEQIISLEEHYVLNTFRDKFSLDDSKAELLISILRANSISHSNSKVKANLDSRIYRYLKFNKGFVSEHDKETLIQL